MQRFESFYSRLWTPDRICQERADDYRGSGWLQSLSPACSKPKVWLQPTLLREEREGKDRRQKAILPTAELNTTLTVLSSISWPLLNSLFRKPVAGWSDRTPDTREPSPGGMQGSLALHGTDVRSPPPSNLSRLRSPSHCRLVLLGASSRYVSSKSVAVARTHDPCLSAGLIS